MKKRLLAWLLTLVMLLALLPTMALAADSETVYAFFQTVDSTGKATDVGAETRSRLGFSYNNNGPTKGCWVTLGTFQSSAAATLTKNQSSYTASDLKSVTDELTADDFSKLVKFTGKESIGATTLDAQLLKQLTWKDLAYGKGTSGSYPEVTGQIWKLDAQLTFYKVTLNANGGYFDDGNNAATKDVCFAKGENISLPDTLKSNDADKPVFGGWYTNAQCTGERVTQVTSDTTLYAKWKDSESVSIVIDAVDSTGTPITDDSQIKDTTFGASQNGVFAIGTLTTKTTLSVKTAAGEDILNSVEPVMSLISQMSAYRDFQVNTGVSSGYNWDGGVNWRELKETPNGWTLHGQITLYKLTLDANDGDLTDTVSGYYQNGGTSAALPTPTRTGHKFLGWFDKNGKQVTTPNTYYVAYDQTLTAHWQINQYTITFDTDGGTVIDPITQDYGTDVTAPKNPTKEGFTFAGWDRQIPTTMPADNVTITAQWSDRALASIKVEPKQTEFVAGTTLKPEDFTVTAVYDNGEEDVLAGGYTIEPAEALTTTGDVTVTAKFGGKTAECTIQVKPAPVIPVTPVEEPTTPWWAFLPVLDQTVDFPFYDVDANDWFYNAVKSAWENELIDGVTARYFKPDNTLTVAQAIKLAAALHQKQSVGFVTLQNGGTHWYDNYVNYAVANGLIEASYQGKSAETMNAPVSRAEFVHILAKLLNAGSINTVNNIPDVKSGDAYADEIFAFYRAGILTGSDRLGTFHPESSLKRSEAAAILVRLYDATQRQYITLR